MSMSSATIRRPDRSFTTGLATKGLRLLGLLMSLAITGWILAAYPTVPEALPTHFGASGAADDWGPRWTILVLAAVMLLLSVVLAVLSTRPQVFNYPADVTDSNAQAIYREGERMMVWMLLALQGIYLGITWSVLRGSGGGGAVLALGIVVMVGVVIAGIIRLARASR